VKSLLSIALLALTIPAHAADPATITDAELLRRTQLMYDSLVPGNPAPWKQYLADDVIICDEKGHNWAKSDQLADISPLPTGYSGTILIDHIKARYAPNVAIFSYDAEETETIFTNVMHARYHTTDTWLYRNHLWQIAASQSLRYYEDPAVGAIPTTLLNDYVGTYELTPGTKLTVTRQGDKLFAQRGSAKPVELLPESPDLFFRTGVEGRRLFHRDSSGKVDMLIDRRNNEDILWKRVS